MSRTTILIATTFALACTKSPSNEAKKADAGVASAAAKSPVAKMPPAKEDIPPPPDVAAPPADAERTASGIASRILKPGTGGERPTKWDDVTVDYTGWTTDGKMFDSSVQKGRPATFNMRGVIPGWTEGIQLMTVGEQRRFWIPEALAYNGKRGGPPGMLVFDLQLLSLKRGPSPLPAPPDVKAPPAGAQKTPKGVPYVVLKKGKGDKHPGETDTVKVDYTGWSVDGEMFDSSVTKGEYASFELNKVIPGWTDVVTQMVPGEKRRAWVPANMAYEGQEGRPQGQLTFDIELLEVLDFTPPKDLATPPASAKKLPSGLATQVLRPGTGKSKPTANARVKAHYVGWTASDGKMFDSSYKRGRPLTLPLSRGLKGWQEGLSLMVAGEKRRFWIPENLAYEGREGAPKGMLVYDFELISFEEPQAPTPVVPTTPGTPVPTPK